MTSSSEARAGRRPARWVLAAWAALALVAPGCGPRTCVVSGRVLVDDRPAEGVYLVFRTMGKDAGPQDSGTARTGEQGGFSLVVREPGEAAITAFWPSVKLVDDESVEGPDRFGGRYGDPRRPVVTATFQEGNNLLPDISLLGAKPGPSRRDSR